MKPITICFPFYRNHGVLLEQLRRFAALPDDLKEYLRLIVVDDGSTILQADETELPPFARAAVWQDIGLSYEIYRLKVNIRWNQDACRNLAVDKASTAWLLLTDMDHIPPRSTLESLVSGNHGKRQVYQFSRMTLNPDGTAEPYKKHPNSWFLTKAMYEEIGGYDERFAGLYGSDGEFRHRVNAVAGEPVVLDDVLLRVPRETIPDASTTSYVRKAPEDRDLKGLIARRNFTPGWQPKRLTFPWERVK